MDWVLLVVALFVILGGAELFTNGIEWVGEGFGLSEGVVGSVLAAVGTALPETLLPLVAILLGHEGGEEIGIGAILGAPFMLTTLAMFVLGVAVLLYSRGGRRDTDLHGDPAVMRQDLGYFLVMYALAVVAGLVHITALNLLLAVVLLVGYVFYVRRHFKNPGERELESEARNELKPLYLKRLLRRSSSKISTGQSTAQVAAALLLMVGGAQLFVGAMETISHRLGVPALAFSLLVAPVATELPEKFNSVLWVRKRKDTLALGNMTGAMVFQSSFPVTIGLLLTPWKLEQDALVAALIALVAGSVLYLTVRIRGELAGWLLLAQGLFYVGYVVYVVRSL